MDRREFIKLSALSAMPLILQNCSWGTSPESKFDITVHSDMKAGHLAFGNANFETGETISIKTLVVGGGIAGLSAAYHLKDKDFLLCELSDQLGGTSSASESQGISFAQGAHYDLSYPQYYGNEVLEMLTALDITYYQPWKHQWGFRDTQYLVPFRIRNHCYENGKFRKDVLPEGQTKEHFFKTIQPYLGKMALPTRLIEEKYHALDQVTFLDFLTKTDLKADAQFIRGLDYHMMDDYGGTASQVSALAGIHYFMCRPYYQEVVELFSPPQGNSYFVNKLAQALPSSQLLTKHMIRRLAWKGNGFEAEVVDLAHQQIKKVKANQVVYAGQKHALKYIYPEGYPLFQENLYAPWMVVNIILDDKDNDGIGYWQNEMLVKDQSFMGFIDSNSQSQTRPNTRVLTGYYCLPPSSRKDLKNVTVNKEEIASNTLKYMESYFGRKIEPMVKQVYIKAMGHAMPIPKPGYLFNDKNLLCTNNNIAYAGVDNSRLPLLFEALDSGIKAVDILEGKINSN